MTIKTILALFSGTLAMLILITILLKHYKIACWRGIPISVLLTVMGTIGTYIWFFVESSFFGGRSYYGAVFLVPLFFKLLAKYVGVPYRDVIDVCAPAECVMLAIMKYQCLIDGCCGGRFIDLPVDGRTIVFPSQMVEMTNALILMVALMCMAFHEKNRGKIYPWYMILYGITRFVLNWFREDLTPLLLGLPAGNLWSVLSVIVGFLWLFDYKVVIVPQKNSHSDISL